MTDLVVTGRATLALVIGPANGIGCVGRGTNECGAMRIIGSTWWKIVGRTGMTCTTGLTIGTGRCVTGVGSATAVDATATAVAMPMNGETRINLIQLYLSILR